VTESPAGVNHPDGPGDRPAGRGAATPDVAADPAPAYLRSTPMSAPSAVELSVVIPCLNEADTLADCIDRAWRGLRAAGCDGEVIVADNGSTDDSPRIASGLGARVVAVEAKGYGSALMGGIAAARGRFIVMGDADGSYDFLEIPKFLDRLREGYDLVQGCRLPSGGGRVLPGAMPLLHRWWGNPMFSLMARRMFQAPIHDIYCGLRGFTTGLYERLDLRCVGMEFATEMVIKSCLRRERIAEVPITLHPDGRKTHAPHLKTFRDGWRTLRFFLFSSPRWLFLVPGALLMGLGLLGFALAMPGVTIRGARLDAHTLLFSALAILAGFDAVVFAICAKLFAISEGLLPEDPRLTRFSETATLEKGLVAGAALLLVGGTLLVTAFFFWRSVGFGNLDYPATMRWVIPGVLLASLGVKTILSSFFLSLLGLRRR
jgi:glycosyltransferase involved in cell wall biosynthesis